MKKRNSDKEKGKRESEEEIEEKIVTIEDRKKERES